MMGKVLILFMALASCVLCDSSYPKSPLQWHKFNQGTELARQQGKAVIIDFYADWCFWCRKMEAEIFSDPQIASRIVNGFITVRVDMESQSDIIRYRNFSLSPKEFATLMGIQGLPSLVFMDKNGTLITRVPGYIEKNIFLPLLGYIKDECYLRQIPFNEYMNGRSDCGGK